MENEKKYSGYGYHGGGRPKAEKTKSANLNIRMSEEDKVKLQEEAKKAGLSVTEYILQSLKYYYAKAADEYLKN